MSEKKSKKFLYEEVKDRLIDIILEREMAPQDILPSENEIAELTGVSKMTVKLALNYLEEQGIIYRLARRGSFLSNDYRGKIDQLLKGGGDSSELASDNKVIALVLPSYDFYTGRIMTSVINEAEKVGWSVIVRITEGDPEKEDQLLNKLSTMKLVKGIILFPTDSEACRSELLRLKLDNYPVVVIDRSFKEVAFDCVSHNNYDGAFEMTKFLIDRGHREIGFISSVLRSAESREERYQGYLHSLLEHNVPIRNDYIFLEAKGLDHSEEGVHVCDSPVMKDLERYLESNRDLTAVFCADDYIAIELYYVAVRLGISVPDQLSIVGFSDNRVLRYIPIHMTTVRQPVDEMAEKAVFLLKKRIDNPGEGISDIKLSTHIRNRSSVKTLI